jgi:hypothetical protein
MKGKRGESVTSMLMYALFEMAIIALFAAAILIKVNAAVNDQTYYQRFIARDAALTVDAMHAMEGNFVIDYRYSTPKPSRLDFFLDHSDFGASDTSSRDNQNRYEVKFLFGTDEANKAMNSTSLEVSTNSVSDESKKIFSREFRIQKIGNEINLSEVGE